MIKIKPPRKYTDLRAFITFVLVMLINTATIFLGLIYMYIHQKFFSSLLILVVIWLVLAISHNLMIWAYNENEELHF